MTYRDPARPDRRCPHAYVNTSTDGAVWQCQHAEGHTNGCRFAATAAEVAPVLPAPETHLRDEVAMRCLVAIVQAERCMPDFHPGGGNATKIPPDAAAQDAYMHADAFMAERARRSK